MFSESSSHDQKAPLFLKELVNTEVLEGETVKFRCKVRAYPPPRVMWYKDGKRLDNGGDYRIGRDILLNLFIILFIEFDIP